MTGPVNIAAFNALKAALARALSPLVNADVRGMEVRLTPRLQSVTVVLHISVIADGREDAASTLRSAMAECIASISAFEGYSCAVAYAECDVSSALIYRGCPVWGRADTQWELAADLAAAIKERQLQPIDDRPPAA